MGGKLHDIKAYAYYGIALCGRRTVTEHEAAPARTDRGGYAFYGARAV